MLSYGFKMPPPFITKKHGACGVKRLPTPGLVSSELHGSVIHSLILCMPRRILVYFLCNQDYFQYISPSQIINRFLVISGIPTAVLIPQHIHEQKTSTDSL
uniref:Uncharacterized protein n=1 Tax=Cacopsylla melanoneura TaxID=428564 RepID=A0A8D8XAT0_9HEMI